MSAWGPPPASGQPRRQGLSPRATIWIIAGVALVAVLIRSHKISTFEILFICAAIPSVILHEISHGVAALAFGDDTAQRAGRVTLNPIKHIDPFGTIILPVLLVLSGAPGAILYAKPVPVNVSRLRNSRNTSVVVSLVGPAVNIALAAVCGLAFATFLSPVSRLDAAVSVGPIWAQLLFVAGYANVILAVFNLIPLPPLDGSAVLERFLPRSLLPGYYRIRPFTMFIPLIIVVLRPSALSGIFDWAINHYASAVGVPVNG
ncbi:MAG TPA: site-2 protease family protein [Acidimicrobiales bacterium]